MNNIKGKDWLWIGFMVLGAAAIAVGAFWFGALPEDEEYYSRISGVLCGMGGGLIGISAAKFFGRRMASPERVRQKAIEEKDERNIEIRRATLSVVAAAAIIMLAIMALTFTLMGLYPADLMCSMAICLLVLIYVVAFKWLEKKM